MDSCVVGRQRAVALEDLKDKTRRHSLSGANVQHDMPLRGQTFDGPAQRIGTTNFLQELSGGTLDESTQFDRRSTMSTTSTLTREVSVSTRRMLNSPIFPVGVKLPIANNRAARICPGARQSGSRQYRRHSVLTRQDLLQHFPLDNDDPTARAQRVGDAEHNEFRFAGAG